MKGTYDKKLLLRFYSIVVEGLNYISVSLIFYVALFVTADVISRNFFNKAIPGTTELVRLCMVVIIFLSLPYTMRQNRHIRATNIARNLFPSAGFYFDIFAFLLGATVFSLFFLFSVEPVWTALVVREYEGVQLRVPTSPARISITIGTCFLAIECLMKIYERLRAPLGGNHEREQENQED